MSRAGGDCFLRFSTPTRLGLLGRALAATGLGLLVALRSSRAAPGQVHLRVAGQELWLQVRGSSKDDWRIQTSTNLLSWETATNFGTLLSGDAATAPWRAVGPATGSPRFYRGLQTDGLFDPTLLRTISLTFSQTNWSNLLALGRTYGTNVLCSQLTLGNGATNFGVGARYRGNTSFTGLPPNPPPTKKSLNLELDYTNSQARLMGYKTVNLNNAYGDETILREPLYFNVMRQYAVCPKAALARLYINGQYWGVYSFVQQENNELIKEWFPSDTGDRWKAPNMPPGGGGFPGPSGVSALAWLGTNWTAYTNNYELKTQNSTNPWLYLVHACDVLNNTPTNQLRDKVEEVLAVDRWLWFLALENIFADDDSYWNKGADYGFYYEPESGRLHPIEHDGNEAFVPGDASLSPVQGATSTNRPLLRRLLGVPELRQRYLAHMRTVLQESFNPATLTPLIDRFVALSAAAIAADTKKGYTMTAYTNDLLALKTFITNRYNFLTNHAELRPVPPQIVAVYGPDPPPTAGQVPFITAHVLPNGTNGIHSVWLYFRDKPYGRFTSVPMFDDGAHGDGLPGDNLFGAATTNFPAGHKIHYYVEARSANAARAAAFSPPRAEEQTYWYRVGLVTAPYSAVVINELMADNRAAFPDPQGQFDDWIELRNLTDQAVDLTGCYLTDEPNNPRKWPFPAGTVIPAGGYLLVWADEDGSATPGLHANFKLAKSGEQVLLIDTDAHLDAVLDWVNFGPLPTDLSWGRIGADPDSWAILDPTPGYANP